MKAYLEVLIDRTLLALVAPWSHIGCTIAVGSQLDRATKPRGSCDQKRSPLVARPTGFGRAIQLRSNSDPTAIQLRT